MTIREKILEQLKTDLLKITTANGYVHNVSDSMIFTSLNAVDDASILPVISVVPGAEESEMTETGLETLLKVLLITRFQTDTDINKTGIVSDEAELWFRDFETLFCRPTQPDVNINHISGLWNIDEPEGGVEYYFISGKDPFADDLKDNRQTILTELTISIINLNS